MKKIEKINEFLFEAEANYDNETVVTGKVVRVSLGRGDTYRSGRNKEYGFGFATVENGERVFFHESRLCEHLELNELIGKQVNIVNIHTSDKGPRAENVRCNECVEPEIWEIIQVHELKGVPKYDFKCTNKPTLTSVYAPTEVSDATRKLNEPYNEMSKKVGAWGYNEKIKDIWFFTTLGKPNKIYTNNSLLVLYYDNFGEKILTPKEACIYRYELNLQIQPAENPTIDMGEINSVSDNRDKVEIDFCLSEFPEIRFKVPVATIDGYRGIAKTNENFSTLDEDSKEKIYEILRESKLSNEDLAFMYLGIGSIDYRQDQESIEKEKNFLIEKFVKENATSLALLELGETPRINGYSYYREVYEPPSPDEMRGGFSYQELTSKYKIIITPKLANTGLLNDYPEEYYTIKNTDAETTEQALLLIESKKDAILHAIKLHDINSNDKKLLESLEDINIDIYQATKEELGEDIKLKFSVFFTDIIKKIEKEKEDLLSLYREATNKREDYLNEIQNLHPKITELEKKCSLKRINFSFFNFKNNEFLEKNTNDQILEYINRINQHIDNLQIELDKSEAEELLLNKTKIQEAPPELKDPKEERRLRFVLELQAVLNKILEPGYLSKFYEIYHSWDKSYSTKRTEISNLILNNSSNLDYEDQYTLNNLLNAQSNSKFLDYIFSLLENNGITQNQKSNEATPEPEIIYEADIPLKVYEEFTGLPSPLVPVATTILEAAKNRGLEDILELLLDYGEAGDKNKQKNIITEIIGEGNELDSFLNLKPGYRTRIVDAVIVEIDRLLADETTN